jgi:nucleotide-binding universal stress UspA family protein
MRMTTEQQDREHIVVGVDGSPASQVAVDWAAHEAALRGDSLRLLHIAQPPTMTAVAEPLVIVGLSEWMDRRGRDALADAVRIAGEAAPQLDVSSEMVTGSAVSGLLDHSKDARMLVVGCRGLGAVGRTLLGSVSSALAHHARCPVTVIRDEESPTTTPAQAPVVVGVDGSEVSERALALAFEEAALRGVGLIAVHAWSDAGVLDFPAFDHAEFQQAARRVLAERLAGWRERYPDVRVERVVAWDSPAHALLEQSRRAQLLVVGSHGRGGFAGMLLGSVSAEVVHGAAVPVTVVRPA